MTAPGNLTEWKATLLRELFEQFALLGGELRRHLDDDLDLLITPPHHRAVWNSLALDAQDRPRLRPGGHP